MHRLTHFARAFALTLAATLALSPVQASELSAPAHAKSATGAPSVGIGMPRGLMADAEVGQRLLRAEADPPTTRGGGGVALERLFAARCRSVVFIVHKVTRGGETGYATGTGSIITIDGHVLTADHVVEGADEVAVGVFPSCKPGAQPEYFPARVVKRKQSADLAILQLTKMPSDISVMPLGQLDDVRTGSSVVIIGHPQGLLMSMSQGVVSAIRPDQPWRAPETVNRRATVIQTDGALNPGNSGGPMMSSDGNLIGVNSFIRSNNASSAGLNFAVAVSEVRSFIAGPAQPAPTAAPAPAAREPETSGASCKARKLKEWNEDGVDYTLLDTTCNGKANAKLAVPQDSSKRPYLLLDRNGDGKADVRIILTRAGDPDYSEWDDDYDGKYDFRGDHDKGNWTPSRKTRLS